MDEARRGDLQSAPDLASLVARRVLDAELAALLEVLVGAHVPVVVAADDVTSRDAIAAALLRSLPPDIRVVELAGAAEEFEWLPEATELGWQRERRLVPAQGRDGVPSVRSAGTVLYARDLAGSGTQATGGARARVAIRSLVVGYGLVATIAAGDLEGVLARLTAPPVEVDEDEASRLGVVLAAGEVGRGTRVLAAHYVRPVARDQHGHVQRLPPAVLATWNMTSDSFDHFAWGVIGELAARTGRTALALEREQARLVGLLRARPAV